MTEITKKFADLIDIIGRLRGPGGCPWDQRQTPQTFKKYLIEETHELIEAIDENSPPQVCEELGDLLFQVIFLCNLYQEKKLFHLTDVIDSISQKMIRRHPHVFSDEKITSEESLRQKWQEIKNQENAQRGKSDDLFGSIPRNLPALRRAQRVADRAARAGFDWPDNQGAVDKLKEEMAELQKALSENHHEQMADEIGDLLFATAVIARKTKIDSEEALYNAINKFITRFNRVRDTARNCNKEIADFTLKELLNFWDNAKESPLPTREND